MLNARSRVRQATSEENLLCPHLYATSMSHNTPRQKHHKMAKRKRNNTQATAVKKQALPAGIPSPPSDSTTTFEPTNASSIVLPEDIEISVETLQTLAQYPAIIKSKACKDLRTAVYGFRQACTTGLNAASGISHHHSIQIFLC